MKVIATSDLHGTLPEIDPCDVLILGGDICPDYLGPTNEQSQRHWLDTKFRAWLNEVPAEAVVGIAGNHDYVFEHSFLIPDELRWFYLLDSEVEIGGLHIYGTPWVPNLPRWAFYGSGPALEARAELIPEGLDFLVSHGPPYGLGDFVPGGTEAQASKYGNTSGMHVGDPFLYDAIVRAKPRIVITGHIHEGYGHYEIKGSEGGVYNAALNDAFYDPVNKPFVFEL